MDLNQTDSIGWYGITSYPQATGSAIPDNPWFVVQSR